MLEQKKPLPSAVVLGSLHLDYIMETPYIPSKGETLSGSNLQIIPGGKGGNQAYYLALQGVSTVMLGKVGTDSMSEPLITSLEEVGVDCSYIERCPNLASGMSIAMVTKDRDYSAIILSGSNQQIDNEYIDSVKDLLLSSSVLVLQYEIPLDSILYAVKLVKDSPCKVILNAAPAYDRPEILEYIDILIVNEVEAGMLTGSKVSDIDSAIDATQVLATKVPVVITTLGSTGLVFSENNNESIFMPAFKVEVVDSHGAGDSFVGALSAKIAEGKDLSDAIEYATCVAALSVQNKGPKNPNVTPNDVTIFRKTFFEHNL